MTARTILASPSLSSAAKTIYSGFYNYALGQGADSQTAHEFGNLGIGTAATEGLIPAKAGNVWGSNPDNGVTALGPFQLNLNNGVGSLFGLSRNSSPDAQINAAASTMWGEPGTGGSYNTQPWNGVGNNYGGSTAYNDTSAAQQAAINTGDRVSGGAGFANAPSAGDGTASPYGGYIGGDGSSAGSPYTAGSAFDLNGASYSAAGAGNPVSAQNPGSVSGVIGSGLGSGASTNAGGGLASLLGQNTSPGAVSGGINAGTASGSPVNITDISYAGQQGAQTLGKAVNDSAAQLGKNLNADTNALVLGANNMLSTFLNKSQDIFIRLFLVLFALVILAGAWTFYAADARKASA
jgi:hypothetical protein